MKKDRNNYSKILLVGLLLPGDHHSFTPLNMAYSAVYLQEKVGKSVNIDFIQLPNCQKSLVATEKEIQEAANKIIQYKPRLIVFFLENILLSMMFYLGFFLKVAKNLKGRWKGKIVIQSYKLDRKTAQKIIDSNPAIDSIILGEPERLLAELVTSRSRKRILENKTGDSFPLEKIPSPYLSGRLDSFLEGDGLVMLETKRGCPGSCYYCFRSVKHSCVRFFSLKRVMDELKYLRAKGIKEVFILDDCFIFNSLYLKRFVNLYKKYFKNQEGPSLALMTRPESLTPKAISLLGSIKTSFIQIGIQSLNKKTFPFFGRQLTGAGIKKIFFNIQKKIACEIWVDLILGLPQDSLKEFKASLDFVLQLNPRWIQIKQLYLNPGTKFYYEKKKHGLRVSSRRDDFRSPFVLENTHFKKEDLKKAFLYIKEKAEERKDIHWKVITAWGVIKK